VQCTSRLHPTYPISSKDFRAPLLFCASALRMNFEAIVSREVTLHEHGPSMKLPDWMFRLIYRYGFRGARLVWRFTQPHHAGALVMLWRAERVVLVRPSYQDVWMAPGGGIEGNENPAQAALREVSEELGLQLAFEQLHLALVVEHFWNNRHDNVHIYEVELSDEPALQIDRREIVEARFVTLKQAESLALSPHLKDYFRMKVADGLRGAGIGTHDPVA
jgi:8-oxo-dGTP diphosphatase